MPRFINIQSYGMIKTIIKAMYSAFISIALISIVLAGWTSYTFVFQSSKSSEIIKVIQDMYASQKSVVIDVIDLSKILIKGTSESIANEKNNLSVQTDLLKEIDKNSQLYLDETDLLRVQASANSDLTYTISGEILDDA